MPNIKFSALENRIKSRYPKFSYKFKDEDSLMQRIGKVLFFNKGFLTVSTTTLGPTVYFPKREWFEANPDNYFETLCHEYVHVVDDAKHPIWFKLKYAFPQILAAPAALFVLLLPILIPLMIFSIISPWWLLTLLTALFLAPIPSTGRTQAELRGYGMSVKVRVWEGIFNDSYFERYAEAFTGSGYYYMCPRKDYIIDKLKQYAESDDCLNDDTPAYRDVYNIIKK